MAKYPKLSQKQIEVYARSAGMANPQIMAAIAMAESGGNPGAHNVVPPDNSYGLWQINMIGAMGPARRREYGITSNEALFNPAINAKAATKIQKSQGLKAWTTYTSGAYKKYMNGSGSSDATQVGLDWDDLLRVAPPYQLWKFFEGEPLPGLDGDTDVPDWVPGESAIEGVAEISQMAAKVGTWMSNPSNWIRVLYVVGGTVVAVAAVSATVRQQAMSQLKSIGGKVIGK
jgi:hypothetical protein